MPASELKDRLRATVLHTAEAATVAPEPAEAPVARTARARRTTVLLPRLVADRLEREARRPGRTNASVVVDAYRNHAEELRAPTGPADPMVTAPPTPSGRRRGVRGVDVALYLHPAQREVLEGAVESGLANSLSDLVTRLLELAYPRRPGQG